MNRENIMDCWNLSLKSTGTSPPLAMKRTRRSLRELLLFPLFLSPPCRAGSGPCFPVLESTRSFDHGTLVRSELDKRDAHEHLQPLNGLLDEEPEGGAVDAVTPSHRRHLEERTRGSHVTDHDCSSLRLGLLQDARPPT